MYDDEFEDNDFPEPVHISEPLAELFEDLASRHEGESRRLLNQAAADTWRVNREQWGGPVRPRRKE